MTDTGVRLSLRYDLRARFLPPAMPSPSARASGVI
jgi:hypothetical protein